MEKKKIVYILSAMAVCLAMFFASVSMSRADASADALYKQAMAIVKESLDEESVKTAQGLLLQAAKLDPGNEDIWIRISWNYSLLGAYHSRESRDDKQKRMELFEKGMAAGEKAQAINPKTVGGIYWYTVNLALTGESKGVLSSFWMAGELFGNLSRVDRRDPYYFYGATRRFNAEIFVSVPAWLTERFGFKPEYMVEDLQWNIEKWPRYFSNYNSLARVYVWADKEDKALEMLEYLLSHKPDIMPEEKADNTLEQKEARKAWKEITGREYPGR